MIQIFHTIIAYRTWRNGLDASLTVGFVPTMGALHEGHASLMQVAVAENDVTVLSIFVNPTQFGPKEDLAKYPRTLEADMALAEKMGVTAVFAPAPAEIYPESENQVLFSLKSMDKKLCGASRPGHFNGVVQVVSLLFHIINPHHAYFGEKDFQQLLIIKQLVKEQHFPIQIHGCPTKRETDGLALSSRNIYLNAEERKQALVLSQVLFYLKNNQALFFSVKEMKDYVNQTLSLFPLAKLDYFEVLEEAALAEIDNLVEAKCPHAFIAVFFGKTRLIDNLKLLP